MAHPIVVQQPMINHNVIVGGPSHPPLTPVDREPKTPRIIQKPVNGTTTVAGNLMTLPERLPDCPAGLENLTAIDKLIVNQKVQLQVVRGVDVPKRYFVKNNLGQDLYYAAEESNHIIRTCCISLRPFYMKIYDNHKNEVIELHRKLACDSACFPYWPQTMNVSAPPGNHIGSIQQEWEFTSALFTIRNADNEMIFRIKGPSLTCSCCSCCCTDIEFIITANGSEQVGKITRQWSGFVKEAFPDANNFGISFPMNLDVKMKAVLLGACFLIDVMYYQHTN